MYRITSGVPLVSIGIMSAVVLSASAQHTTTHELRQFEVVSIDGNKVVVKGARGAQEITVPDDFHLTVDGKPVSVQELKPGMRGTASITTTMSSIPVHVTEVRNGEVMRKVGNSIVVRGANGMQMFSEADADRRGVRIIKNGEPIAFTDIRQGDRLTATIVTTGAPRVMTQRQVQAALSSNTPDAVPTADAATTNHAAPTSGASTTKDKNDSPVPAASSAPARTPVASAAAPHPELPKTGSPMPLVGVVGACSLFAGLMLTAARRRSTQANL